MRPGMIAALWACVFVIRAVDAQTFVEGQPIEKRAPEKDNDRPAFPEQTRAPYHASPSFKVTTLLDNLPAPWSLAFLPDGKILFTERLPGRMRILDAKGGSAVSVAGLTDLASPGSKDVGLLDVALDPQFAANHRIFFTFFDFVNGTNSNTWVARARLDEPKGALIDAKVIFRAQPAMPSKRLGGKTGGRIAIAPDGSLFVTIGDRSDSPPWDVAQRLDTDLGKIIHITAEGAPAPGNPFIGKPGALPEIWALGTRSQEGLAFDPKTGKLWEIEHGPRGGDELNIIEKGRNYGWPIIAHGIDYPGTPIGDGITHKAGMEEPVYYWDPVIAPSGLAFYNGSLFPQWGGQYLRRWSSCHDAGPAHHRKRQSCGGRTPTQRFACADSRRARCARRRCLCADRQRNGNSVTGDPTDQQAAETDA
ncbi:MAG TPA: PQQ-dependent sugar dehydrogenase [Bryobacteraceae bacterium]|nr:PQQ-dependent sugar dehydrogenase [Bryobacteraceae bacterium]